MVRTPGEFQNRTSQTGSRSPERGYTGSWAASGTKRTSAAPEPRVKAQAAVVSLRSPPDQSPSPGEGRSLSMDVGELCSWPSENLADSNDKKGKLRQVRTNEVPAKMAIKGEGISANLGHPSGDPGEVTTRL